VRDLIGEPYVLSVSTIEVRKNHMYMIRVWEMLIKKNIPNIPLLVFIGKVGWDIEPFLKYLNESDHLGGRLHVIHGVTGYELSELYRYAMFTMFPSFVEGFGLPVGESLAYGKPCISSNRSSMPEVGGKFARYVNPDDVREGYVEVERLLTHRDELDRWAFQIASDYKPRTWFEFVTDFFNAATEVDKIPGGMNGVIDAGDIVGMGRDARTALGLSCGGAREGMACGRGMGVLDQFAPRDRKTGQDGVVDIVLVSAGQFGRPDLRELYVRSGTIFFVSAIGLEDDPITNWRRATLLTNSTSRTRPCIVNR
jgi:hypothetical protein